MNNKNYDMGEDHISLPKPQPRLGDAKPEDALVWDARYVQRLINKAGESASVLVLGKHEAEALEDHLRLSFPGDEISLKDYRYAGLRVVTVADESCIKVETARSIFESSRHALLRKHEERPRGEGRKNLEKSAFSFRLWK